MDQAEAPRPPLVAGSQCHPPKGEGQPSEASTSGPGQCLISHPHVQLRCGQRFKNPGHSVQVSLHPMPSFHLPGQSHGPASTQWAQGGDALPRPQQHWAPYHASLLSPCCSCGDQAGFPGVRPCPSQTPPEDLPRGPPGTQDTPALEGSAGLLSHGDGGALSQECSPKIRGGYIR